MAKAARPTKDAPTKVAWAVYTDEGNGGNEKGNTDDATLFYSDSSHSTKVPTSSEVDNDKRSFDESYVDECTLYVPDVPVQTPWVDQTISVGEATGEIFSEQHSDADAVTFEK